MVANFNLWQEEGRGFTSIEDCVDGAIQRSEEYINKSKERLITTASKSNDNETKKMKKIIIGLNNFFSLVLADGLLLECEWQQVSSSLQDSSQYSGWS